MSNSFGYKPEVSNMYPQKCLFSLGLSFDRWFTSLAFLLSSGQTENLSVSHQMSILKAFSTCSLSQALPSPFQRCGLGDTASVGTGRCHLSSETHSYAVMSHLPWAAWCPHTMWCFLPIGSHKLPHTGQFGSSKSLLWGQWRLTMSLSLMGPWSRRDGEGAMENAMPWWGDFGKNFSKEPKSDVTLSLSGYTELWFRLFRFNTNLYRSRASALTLDTSSTSPSFTGGLQR